MTHYKLLIYFLSVTAIVDAINGFFIFMFPNSQLTPGQVFRIIFICTLIFYMLKYKLHAKDTIFLGLCSFYFIVNTLVTTFAHSNVNVLIADITIVSKLLLPLLIILVLKRLNEIEPLKVELIEKIIERNLLFLTISLIILKFLNIGQEAYVGEVGFKGFYNSNNELSIVLGIMFVYSIHKFLYKGSIKYLIYLLLVISASILIGAKTSYIIIASISLVYLFREIKNKKLITLIKFIPAIILLLFIAYKVFSSNIEKILEKQIYNFYSSEGLISFILSNRNILWDQVWNTYIEGKINLFTILFGFKKVITTAGTSFINIELDLNALLVNYGVIGFIFIVPFFMWILIKGLRLKENTSYPYKLSFMIFMFFSIFAGHVFFGVFANTFLAIICLPLVLKNELGNNED